MTSCCANPRRINSLHARGYPTLQSPKIPTSKYTHPAVDSSKRAKRDNNPWTRTIVPRPMMRLSHFFASLADNVQGISARGRVYTP